MKVIAKHPDGTPDWWVEVDTEEEAYDLIDRYTVDGDTHYFQVIYDDKRVSATDIQDKAKD